VAQVGLRFNLDAEEVELTVDGQTALTSGQDVFKSWVDAYNDKHKPSIDEPVEEKEVDLDAEENVDVDEPVDTDDKE
jgi:hypothetical protein